MFFYHLPCARCWMIHLYAFIPPKKLKYNYYWVQFSFPKSYCWEMAALGLLSGPDVASIFRPSWIQQQILQSVELYISVCQGCKNKIPLTEWLKQQIYFLSFLEAGSSRRQLGQVLLRPVSLARRWPPPCSLFT